MLGLMEKDLRLMRGQRQFFLVIVMVSVAFVAGGQDAMFAVSYCTMICTFFTISTISYDEFNHGFAFLFTLPIDRRGYVIEKYLFGALIGGITWLVTTLLGGYYNSLRDPQFMPVEWVASTAAFLLLMFVFLCVLLPLHFKFGAEKSKTAVFIVMIVTFGGVAMLLKIEGMADTLGTKLQWLESLGMAGWCIAGLLALAAATVISIMISTRIVERKQF